VSYEKIKTTVDNGIATVTLSDPKTLNAAGVDLVRELHAAFEDHAKPDSGARCVILTGEGRGFCSGANLTRTPEPGLETSRLVLERVYNPFISLMRDYPLPIITAVNGVAAGIGCSMALMGDLIVAAESAYFLQAFRRIGLVPDGGATYLLARTAGRARAMELTLLGDKLPARTALEWGLINRCVPDDQLMTTTLELAKALAGGPVSLSYTRKMVWEGLDAEWAEQLAVEAKMQDVAAASADAQEGRLAFVEKRPAVFTGR